jgi:glycosyltransferase involved in cell wall biosynthesis
VPDQLLPDDLRRRIDAVGEVDLLVGIPAFNNAATIGRVVTAVEAGIRKFFPELRAVIVVSDGGSEDGTLDAAMAGGVGEDAERYLVDPKSPEPEKVGFAYRGIPGKGSAFRSVFEVARQLSTRSCAVVDSDLRSITPAWLDALLTPVVHHGYGFVAPVYERHRFDGTITNSIAYPVTTALYGARLRQPIGGEFAFSGDLAAAYADEDVWETDVARFGIDIWMTTVAVVEGARVCQANLGAKIHDPKDPGAQLGPMFRQVVGSLFALAGKYRERWTAVGPDDLVEPPTFGMRAAYAAEPVEVSLSGLTWRFVEGYVHNQGTWRKVMTPETFAGVMDAISTAAVDPRGFRLPAEAWLRIVYDYLIAYNDRRVDPGALLDSLIPLYFARTASWIQEVADLSNDEAEREVERYVDVAVDLKQYLVRRWEQEGVPDHQLAQQPVAEDGQDLSRSEELPVVEAT